MLTIIPGSAMPAPPRLVNLLIVDAPELPDDQIASMHRNGHTLRVNPTATEAEQLAAIRDAVTYLWTADRGGRTALALRHLKVVPA